MTELVSIRIDSLALMIIMSCALGMITGVLLAVKYMPRKGGLSRSQRELSRLAKHIHVHHPEKEREAPVVDLAIELIEESRKQA